MRRQRNYSQLKGQKIIPEKTDNETEINNLPDKEFKTLVIKMLTDIGKRIDLNTDHLNKDLKNIKMTQSKINDSTSEILKNTLVRMNSRLNNTEECISDLEDRIMKITQTEEQKRKTN